jgi:hypothetical protein
MTFLNATLNMFARLRIPFCRYSRLDGRSGFATPDLARRFREAAYRGRGMEPPAALGTPPRTITLLSAVRSEEVQGLKDATEFPFCILRASSIPVYHRACRRKRSSLHVMSCVAALVTQNTDTLTLLW